MMGITVVSGALTQVPAGRLSDLTDRRYVIAGAAIAAGAAGLALLVLKPADPTLVIALAGIYGALTYPLYGLAVAHANDYADAGDFVADVGRPPSPLRRRHHGRAARRRPRHDVDRPGGAVRRHRCRPSPHRQLCALPHHAARQDPGKRPRGLSQRPEPTRARRRKAPPSTRAPKIRRWIASPIPPLSKAGRRMAHWVWRRLIPLPSGERPSREATG